MLGQIRNADVPKSRLQSISQVTDPTGLTSGFPGEPKPHELTAVLTGGVSEYVGLGLLRVLGSHGEFQAPATGQYDKSPTGRL
jgi:hypothetical protein